VGSQNSATQVHHNDLNMDIYYMLHLVVFVVLALLL